MLAGDVRWVPDVVAAVPLQLNSSPGLPAGTVILTLAPAEAGFCVECSVTHTAAPSEAVSVRLNSQ